MQACWLAEGARTDHSVPLGFGYATKLLSWTIIVEDYTEDQELLPKWKNQVALPFLVQNYIWYKTKNKDQVFWHAIFSQCLRTQSLFR